MTAEPVRLLFQRWPALAPNLPFVLLGNFPTPLEERPELAIALGVDALTLKREDLSAADYGGNKIRKLEFLLGDAIAQNRQHIVTFGGFGSNHAIATALNSRKFGLHCTAVLTPEPITDQVRAALARHIELGTRVVVADQYGGVRAAAAAVIAEYGAEHCYEIPFGGSSWTGALGFVEGALELAEQIRTGEGRRPDVIYLACGTTGTVAGLALGLTLAGLDCRIEAVQVTPDSLQQDRLVVKLIEQAAHELQARGGPHIDTAHAIALVHIRNDQLGEGYAEPTAAGRDAAERWHRACELPVSLTYTAKALAALVADAAAGQLQGREVLFWNTYNSRPYVPPTDTDWSVLPLELQRLLQA